MVFTSTGLTITGPPSPVLVGGSVTILPGVALLVPLFAPLLVPLFVPMLAPLMPVGSAARSRSCCGCSWCSIVRGRRRQGHDLAGERGRPPAGSADCYRGSVTTWPGGGLPRTLLSSGFCTTGKLPLICGAIVLLLIRKRADTFRSGRDCRLQVRLDSSAAPGTWSPASAGSASAAAAAAAPTRAYMLLK